MLDKEQIVRLKSVDLKHWKDKVNNTPEDIRLDQMFKQSEIAKRHGIEK